MIFGSKKVIKRVETLEGSYPYTTITILRAFTLRKRGLINNINADGDESSGSKKSEIVVAYDVNAGF